jgi:hypothetical protein
MSENLLENVPRDQNFEKMEEKLVHNKDCDMKIELGKRAYENQDIDSVSIEVNSNANTFKNKNKEIFKNMILQTFKEETSACKNTDRFEKECVGLETDKDEIEAQQEGHSFTLRNNHDMSVRNKSDSDITHEELTQNLNNKIKATNWSICIWGEAEQLEKMQMYLMNEDKILAMQGHINLARSVNEKTYLHSMLKYEKQSRLPTIHNLLIRISEKIDFTKTPVISIAPVIKPEHIKTMLEKIQKKQQGREIFKKGEFTYSRCKENLYMEAVQWIREYGPLQAGEMWAGQHKPCTQFKKALKQYDFEKEYEERKELRDEARQWMMQMYPWQEYVFSILKEEPDTRKIYVVLDKEGASGKTTFQNKIKDLFCEDVIDIKNGRTIDMTYIAAYGGNCKIVQINLTRQNMDSLNYGAIEMIKDGNFATTKYRPKAIRRKPPHIFIYTNQELDWKSMTKDRWQIIYLHKCYATGFKTFTWLEWTAQAKY